MNSSLKENNAWVTGHSGFIGNSLIEDLNDEFNIFKISRKEIIEKNFYFPESQKLNHIDINLLKNIHNNFLFHLATYYKKEVNFSYDAKIMIESNLLFGIRLIYKFGLEFFSKILLTQSYLELNNSNSFNLYSQTKSIFANEVQKMMPDKTLKVYIFDTFGLNDKRKKLIKIWLEKLLKNEPVEINNNKITINLSSNKFISNIISKIKLINPGFYELRSDVELTLSELFDLLREITNSRSEKIVLNKKIIEIPKYYENLSNILSIKYTIHNFKKDIIELINNEFYEKK